MSVQESELRCSAGYGSNVEAVSSIGIAKRVDGIVERVREKQAASAGVDRDLRMFHKSTTCQKRKIWRKPTYKMLMILLASRQGTSKHSACRHSIKNKQRLALYEAGLETERPPRASQQVKTRQVAQANDCCNLLVCTKDTHLILCEKKIPPGEG
jgi:hypothetical protein